MATLGTEPLGTWGSPETEPPQGEILLGTERERERASERARYQIKDRHLLRERGGRAVCQRWGGLCAMYRNAVNWARSPSLTDTPLLHSTLYTLNPEACTINPKPETQKLEASTQNPDPQTVPPQTPPQRGVRGIDFRSHHFDEIKSFETE